MKIGLCGLPNSGKSTFIKLVSKAEVLIAPYPFTTLKSKEYAVPVISEELKLLHSITKTNNLVPPYIFFVDIPGLIRGAHKGEGLGNEFLSYLRSCDVVLEIARNFKRDDVPHPEGEIDPLRDILIIEDEIIKADEEIIQRAINKLEKEKTKELLEKLVILKIIYKSIKDNPNNEFNFRRFPEYSETLKEFNLLLTKEWFLLLNGPTEDDNFLSSSELLKGIFKNIYHLDLLLEIELLEETDLNKFVDSQSKVYNFLNQLRKDVGLNQFFTYNKDKTQGWFVKSKSKIIEVVSKIHSDFVSKFKMAESISLDKFLEIGDWEKAKKLGLIKYKGREATVEENEIIFIKI